MLIHLSLASCMIARLDNLTLPNLRSLDLSDNLLNALAAEDLKGMRNLQVLLMAANPTTTLFTPQSATPRPRSFPSLLRLDVPAVGVTRIDEPSLSLFPNLLSLNLSGSKLAHVAQGAFRALAKLEVLDLRGCPLEDLPAGRPEEVFFSAARGLRRRFQAVLPVHSAGRTGH